MSTRIDYDDVDATSNNARERRGSASALINLFYGGGNNSGASNQSTPSTAGISPSTAMIGGGGSSGLIPNNSNNLNIDDVTDSMGDTAIHVGRHESVPAMSEEDTWQAIMTIEKRKEKDKSQLLWVYQIPARTCKGELREVTLRSLLQEVLNCSDELDEKHNKKKGRIPAQANISGPISIKPISLKPPASVSEGRPYAPSLDDIASAYTQEINTSNHNEPAGDVGVDSSGHGRTVSDSEAVAIPATKRATMRRRSVAAIQVEVDNFKAKDKDKEDGHSGSSPAPDVVNNRESISRASDVSEGQSLNSDESTNAAIPIRIRDLRRLDFTVNPNVELTVQVICSLTYS
jgi:hypothetical protein